MPSLPTYVEAFESTRPVSTQRMLSRLHSKPKKTSGSIPAWTVVQTGDVAHANGVIQTHTGMYNEVGLAQSRMWPAGTMCITIAATIADSGILGFDACIPDSVVGFIPSPHLGNARYFEYFIRTAKARLEDFAPSTAQKNINLGILETVLIPLPPAKDMHRIVAKVDHLMSLCDALEAKLKQSLTDGDQLLAAAVHQLLNHTAGAPMPCRT